MITWEQLKSQLRQCDDVVTGRNKRIPCKESEAQGYMIEMQQELVRQLSALCQRQVVDNEFQLHTRIMSVTGGAQQSYISIHPQMYGQLRTDLILSGPGVTINNVEIRIGLVLAKNRISLSDIYKERGKTKPGTAQMIVKELPLTVKPILVGGLTPVQCYERLLRWQNEDSAYRSGGAKLKDILTVDQLAMARKVWSSFLSDKVKQSEHARHEADRLQVVVDFEED